MKPVFKNILIVLGCILVTFYLYKYFNSVAVVEGFGDNTKTGFGTIDTTGLGNQAQVFISGYNALGRMYYGGDAIPASPKVDAVLNADGTIKTPAIYGTLAQPAIAALPKADQLAIKRAIRNIIAEIESN